MLLLFATCGGGSGAFTASFSPRLLLRGIESALRVQDIMGDFNDSTRVLTENGRVIRGINFTDSLFDLLSKLCLDLLFVPLVFLVHPLQVIVILDVLAICLSILLFLLLTVGCLGELGLGVFDLLLLKGFVAMGLRYIAIAPLEDYRLATNPCVDVKHN